MGKLQDHVVIITGGGGGIARGVGRAFVKEGAKLVLTDVSEKALADAKADLEGLGGEVLALICDGSDEQQVIDAVQKTVDRFGRIDAVINSAQAGGASGKLLIEQTREQWEKTISTGLFAAFFFMKHAHPYLKEVHGSVVNFASGSGIGGNPGQAAYASTKEAIRGLSRVAANEWGPDDINVNIVLPLVMSPHLEEWAKREPEAFEKNIRSIPLGRYGDAEKDVGRICAFLCSEDASYITGDTVFIQGGLSMKP